MALEIRIIRCDKCAARIALRGENLFYTRSPKHRAQSQTRGALHEGTCPKCDTPFEVWYVQDLTSTHLADVEVDRPDVFVEDAIARVQEAANKRAEQERLEEESRLQALERRKVREQAREADRQRAEEERRLTAEAARVAQTAGDDGGWDDYDDGRSPNDDRSDSMNPNNDAYQDAMDNHANQMNPNNDAYRGR